MRPGFLFRAACETRPFPLTLAAALFLLSPGVAWADSVAVSLTSPDWFVMAMGLLGGLALFLFGMEQMSDALKTVAGDQMKVLLTRLTRNRVMAATTGALVTAVIQSSSVTTVLVVGFVSAGLMSMTQSIGIIRSLHASEIPTNGRSIAASTGNSSSARGKKRMRNLMQTLGMAAMLVVAPIHAAAQAEPAAEDFTLTTCGDLAELTHEDRAFALVFYYGQLVGHSGARVIDNALVPEHLLRVRDYCRANPDSPVVDAFVAALK